MYNNYFKRNKKLNYCLIKMYILYKNLVIIILTSTKYKQNERIQTVTYIFILRTSYIEITNNKNIVILLYRANASWALI